MNQDIIRKLVDNEARRDAQMRSLDEKLNIILERTNAKGFALLDTPSHITKQGSTENIEMPTASLSITTLCWLHRLITENTGLQEAVRGRLRSVRVWIGGAGSTPETASYLPPPPEEVVTRLNSLIEWWKEQHSNIQLKGKAEKIGAIAEFHHRFLSIHPFLDGNGRMALALLDQAARELLNQSIGKEFTNDPEPYFKALDAAHKGNFAPLTERIAASLV